jgi:allantoinase
MAGRKGALALGADADFFAFDPEAQWTVRGAELQHRHPATPYEGRRLRGVVERAWQRGHRVYDRRRGLFAAPAGEVILRR